MDTEAVLAELETVTLMNWQPLLPEEIRRIGEPDDRVRPLPTRCAVVHIVGNWCGSISIECSVPMSDTATRHMLLMDSDARVSEDDWQCVLKELANVIGGNIKGIFAQGCILSPPEAYENIGYVYGIPETPQVLRLWFESDAQLLKVVVHEGLAELSLG